jgi:hypothetical protein
MFYPILTSLQIEEARERDGLAPESESRQPVPITSSVPTRWDYLLLHLGDWLIHTGKRVRSGSAYSHCCESQVLRANTVGR